MVFGVCVVVYVVVFVFCVWRYCLYSFSPLRVSSRRIESSWFSVIGCPLFIWVVSFWMYFSRSGYVFSAVVSFSV